MPRTRAALRLTDAYRREQVAVRDRALRILAERWRTFDEDDVDGSARTLAPELVAIIAAAKRANAAASPAYLAQYIALELDEPAGAPRTVSDRALLSSAGGTLAEPIAGLGPAVKWAIGNGYTRNEAKAFGYARLAMIASSEVVEAGREALLEAMQADDRVTGYERVVYGTCGACLARHGEASSKREPLAKHPHCRCMTEPVVTPPLDEKRVKQWTLQPPATLRKHLANPNLHAQDRAEITAALERKTGKRAALVGKRPTGRELFDRLPKAKQDATLGKSTAGAVRKGRVKLDQLAKTERGTLTQRPLREVIRTTKSGKPLRDEWIAKFGTFSEADLRKALLRKELNEQVRAEVEEALRRKLAGQPAVRAVVSGVEQPPRMTVERARELWGTKTGDFFTSLTPAQFDAMQRYSGADYVPFNSYLRKIAKGQTPRLTRTLAGRLNALTEAIERTPLPETVRVQRQTKLSAFGGTHPAQLVGETVTEPGFLSTSTKSLEGFGGFDQAVKMNITAPAGTRAAYMEPITQVKGEQEILFGKGTQLRIDAVHEHKVRGKFGTPDRTVYEIDATIVGSDSTPIEVLG